MSLKVTFVVASDKTYCAVPVQQQFLVATVVQQAAVDKISSDVELCAVSIHQLSLLFLVRIILFRFLIS